MFDAEVADEFLYELDRAKVRHFSRDVLDFQTAGQSDAAVEAGFALRIEVHDVRQTDGVRSAVVHSCQRRKRMRERVRRAQIFLKRHAAHRRSD